LWKIIFRRADIPKQCLVASLVMFRDKEEIFTNAATVRLSEPKVFSVLPKGSDAAYDKNAQLYERLVKSFFYNKIMWGTSPNDYTFFARQAVLLAKGLNLDIGCGGLAQTSEVYLETKQNFFLLDNSIEMLRIAKSRLIERSGQVPDNINFIHADAFNLPFPQGTFDNIFSFGMIHLFEDKLYFIDSALNALKAGGYFYFTCLTSDRIISRHYLNLLRRKGMVGQALYSKEVLRLFTGKVSNIQHFMRGSMIFILGKK
jgi:SAM-dependent methyltransferase